MVALFPTCCRRAGRRFSQTKRGVSCFISFVYQTQPTTVIKDRQNINANVFWKEGGKEALLSRRHGRRGHKNDGAWEQKSRAKKREENGQMSNLWHQENKDDFSTPINFKFYFLSIKKVRKLGETVLLIFVNLRKAWQLLKASTVLVRPVGSV